MSAIPSISEAEWEVMKVLWHESPRTAKEVIEELTNTTDWNPKTIRTLMNRLVKKGAIAFHREKVYTYIPLYSEKECTKAKTKSFMQRIYGGALTPLFVNFLREEKLSQEDIDELKKILYENTP